MKCKICGNKTDWDSSYGRLDFIVCSSCHYELTRFIEQTTKENYPDLLATDIILKIGYMLEKKSCQEIKNFLTPLL